MPGGAPNDVGGGACPGNCITGGPFDSQDANKRKKQYDHTFVYSLSDCDYLHVCFS